MKDSIGVGLIGLGTVGSGVIQLLQDPPATMRSKSQALQVRRVAVRDLAKARSVDLPAEILTADAMAVIEDPQVDMVVEVSGASDAYQWIRAALEKGKDVVTANKALLAEQGAELYVLAKERGADLMFEASVAGSIPIIRSLRNGLIANRIDSIYGILNGTTNYMLTRMSQGGGDYSDALAEAQEKGFAEPDPTMDVSGMDAAQKLAILSRIAFQCACTGSDIFCEGIEKIEAKDIEYARQLGYTIKLLAIAKLVDGQLEARVHPAMVPSERLMASINDEFNAVEVVGSAVGTQVFYGRGAGQMPTASAVVADMVDLAERRQAGASPAVGDMILDGESTPILPIDKVCSRYYLRLMVYDRAGVLRQITRILADEGISIASIMQKERDLEGGTVPLVIVVHEAKEAAMRRAIDEVRGLVEVEGAIRLIRMEELD